MAMNIKIAAMMPMKVLKVARFLAAGSLMEN